MNEIRTQLMKHRRVDLLKLLYKKGAISPDALSRLFNEDVQAGVEVDSDGSLNDAVKQLTPGMGGIIQDLIGQGEMVRGDVRESVGFSRSASGEYMGKTHISAKETDVVQWANQIRIDERRDIVADILTNIVRKFNQVVFEKWNAQMVRSIVGPDGAKWWLKFSGAEIKGEYNIKVDPLDAVPVNPETRKKEALDMAQGYAMMNQGMAKSGVPAPMELQKFFFGQFDGIDLDKLMAQIQGTGQQAQMMGPGGAMGAPGPGQGQNPGMALPPQIAAQLMQGGQK
jgi:hypothetical protein